MNLKVLWIYGAYSCDYTLNVNGVATKTNLYKCVGKVTAGDNNTYANGEICNMTKPGTNSDVWEEQTVSATDEI
jgi:hypothetical protein